VCTCEANFVLLSSATAATVYMFDRDQHIYGFKSFSTLYENFNIVHYVSEKEEEWEWEGKNSEKSKSFCKNFAAAENEGRNKNVLNASILNEMKKGCAESEKESFVNF
jgi:hypothetical protein